MPEISRFLGIVIYKYFSGHNPPRIHVKYNEFKALMSIDNLNLLEGYLPARVRGIVEEWVEIHRGELLEIWSSKSFRKIPPLI